MKKNLTKKLMLSVLTLAFAVVSLGASTFAWFTTMGTADVAPFEGQVVSSEGIEIGFSAIGATADQITWKTGSITPDEISGLLKEINGEDWEFTAATPNSLVNNYDFTDVNGTSKEDMKGSYVGFSLHFQLSNNTTGKEYPVYMKQLELTNPAGVKVWDCDTEIVISKDGATKTVVSEKYDYDVLAATRLAIFVPATQVEDDPDTPENESVDGENNPLYEFAGFAGFYEPSKTQQSGEVYTKGFAGLTADNAAFGALELYNGRMNASEVAPENEVVTFVDVPTIENAEDYIIVGTISGDQVLTLNVYLWVEGWDAECLNTLFAQALKLDLGFELGKANE